MPGSLIQGNALHIPLKDKSVQLCCFSPPYWNLRKYSVPPIVFGDPDCSHVWGKPTRRVYGGGDSLEKTPGFNGYAGEDMSRRPMLQGRFCKKCGAWEGQMGLEPNIDRYLDNLMLAMAEVWRVLRDDGVCFVNLADTFYSSKRSVGGLNLKKEDASWLAAFIDGEGSLMIHRQKENKTHRHPCYQAFISIAMTEREMLDRAKKITGVGYVVSELTSKTAGNKPIFRWGIRGKGAIEIIRAIYPYLMLKRKQAVFLVALNKHVAKCNFGKGRPITKQALLIRKKWHEAVKELNQTRRTNEPLPAVDLSCPDNPNMRPKSLCLIPQKFAVCCQEAGWIVRSEIIWHKPNPMPESCNDRPTKSHEQVWLLTKSEKYFWDKEAVKERTRRIAKVGWKESDLKKYSCDPRLEKQGTYKDWRKYCPTDIVERRNIRSVWTMATEPHPEAHFATFPSKLVDAMVRAGSSPRACEICGAPWVRILKKEAIQRPECEEAQYAGKYYDEGRRSAGRRVLKSIAEFRAQGRDHDNPFPRTRTIGWRKTCKCDCDGTGRCVVFDPFVGIGTTVVVAEKHGRAGVGMDLSLEYLVDIALKKIRVPVQKMLELRF